MQVAELLKEAANRLAAVSESASLDAQVLLAHTLGKPRPWLLAHPEIEIGPDQVSAYREGLARLVAGEALPYLLGHWEFFGREFILTPEVLIPRPETELLVERALDWLGTHPDRRRLADIGTGSGCIAISLALHVPDVFVVGTDLSPAALDVARTNAKKHNVSDRVQFLHADLLNIQPAGLPVGMATFNLQPFDSIVANLPYIPSARLKELEVARKEPLAALDGGADGLELVRRLLEGAPGALAPGGLLLLEIDSSHAEAARALAQAAFPHSQATLIPDLAGYQRLVEIRLS